MEEPEKEKLRNHHQDSMRAVPRGSDTDPHRDSNQTHRLEINPDRRILAKRWIQDLGMDDEGNARTEGTVLEMPSEKLYLLFNSC